MSFYRYTFWVLSGLVGSEIIFLCLRKVYLLLQEKYKCVENGSGTSVYMQVIFFPDQGITGNISNSSNFGSVNNSPFVHDLTSGFMSKQAKENVNEFFENSNQISLHARAEFLQSSNQPFIPTCHTSSGIKSSTSLDHLVKVLDSAQRSIVVCLYTLSCRDMVDALVRAKVRGVHVRVLLDGNMCTEACQTTMDTFRQNNVPARSSHPSFMMHHKFAIVDAPTETSNHPQAAGTTEFRENIISHQPANGWTFGFGNVLKFFSELKPRVEEKRRNSGILMTGSFNWTWSAVINNHENVVITNHPVLVQQFIKEFEALWLSAAQA